ncbi:Heat induced stress protein YflT [Seinonella peptonophila]|uniref:Heat induced stress protein YflT n=1 Tax=Seinonella peptonophila TaxID=112248 RepID=A0A1M4U9S2_9BACL|nr:general stress protein [Seinonella peptonophila]SHE53313.1 Heat induced stress protein YflT [Seinonella peptonophila]
MSRPLLQEFSKDEHLISEVHRLKSQGVKQEDLYILTHDHDRTSRIAEKADVNTIGISETGVGTAIQNLFRKKGDALRNEMIEMGFDSTEVEVLEDHLDKGRILLIVDTTPYSQSLFH